MVVVGIDSAQDRVDAVAMEEGCFVPGLAAFTIDLAKVNKMYPRGLVLTRMQMAVAFWLSGVSEVTEQEPQVFIEESIVMRHNLRVAVLLAETVGMLLALPYTTEVVPIDSWKMAVIGKGGVDKETVKQGIIRRLPQTEQMFGKRQDLFDATGVAIYGAGVLRHRPR